MNARIVMLAAVIFAVSIFSPSSEAAKSVDRRSCWTTDDRYPCGGGVDMMGQSFKGEPLLPRARKWRKRTAPGFLTSIQCGPRRVMVRRTAAVQLEGFCKDLYAIYKFKAVGGYRGEGCSERTRHGCGSAIDAAQWCRGIRVGVCVPKDFPVAESEKLAARWGLFPGSKWNRTPGSPDIGHFQTAGALYGSDWSTNKAVQVASAAMTALKPADPPPPPHPLLGAAHQSGDLLAPLPADINLATPATAPPPVESQERVMTPFAWSVYGEILPRDGRPVVRALEGLRTVPVGSAREEIARASALTGLPVSMLNSFARIESSFNCGLQDRRGKKRSKYKGLFQLSDFEFKRYGGGGNIWNCRDNAIAAAHKFLVEGAFFQHASGRWPSFFDAYMIHQQGLEGAAEHAARPDRLAILSMCATGEGREKGPAWCRKAICGNVPSDLADKRRCASLTSGEFSAIWKRKVNRFAGIGTFELAGAETAKVKVAQVAKKKRHKKRHRHHRVKLANVH